VFLLLVLSVLAFNISSSFQLEQDAARINLAGSQRALTQQMGKAILALQQEKRDNLSLDNSLKELRGGQEQFDTNLKLIKAQASEGSVFDLVGLNVKDTLNALAQVDLVWSGYKAALLPIIQSAGSSIEASAIATALADSKSTNDRLMQASNEVVNQVAIATESKAQIMRWVQVVVIVLALANFAYMALSFFRQLLSADKQAQAAQKETFDILNTVDEGLLLIDDQGKTGTQMSQAVHTLFERQVEPGEDFRIMVSRLVDSERADEIKIYIDLLYDHKVKPALLVQLDPMKEIEVISSAGGKKRFLSFNLRQLRNKDSISGLLVTIFDVTPQVLLKRELSNTQTDARTDVEDLLRVFEQEPATMQEFLSVAKQKLNHLNEAMRTVGKTSTAYSALIKSTAVTIHGIKGESAALGLTGVSRQAHVMENKMEELVKRRDLSGEDLIPVVFELSRVQEQLERIEKLFLRIAGPGAMPEKVKPLFAPTVIMPQAMVPDLIAAPIELPVLNQVVPHFTPQVLEPKLSLTSIEPFAAAAVESQKPQEVDADKTLTAVPKVGGASVASVLGSVASDSALSPATVLFPGHMPALEEMAQNLNRLATTVARDLGKDVLFNHSIEALQIGQKTLRTLREVLPQLVRNSVAHGIEIPSERAAQGKALQGVLHLAIRKHGDDTVEVSLKDDGRGITVEAVTARLLEMKVDVSGLSKGQILQQIFEPQFSTSHEVTEHAGRGVGLSLVKQSLENAGAKLKVNTRPGQLTEFTISFGSAS
jgi:signal transduction histidine kinase